MKCVYVLSLFLLVSCAKKAETTSNDNGDSVKVEMSKKDEQELERLLAEVAFSELGTYDGEYKLANEGRTADATLVLKYLGDRKFKFSLQLVSNICKGVVEDTALVDEPQHVFFDTKGCLLHFNLLEKNVEINEPKGCIAYMNGACSFAGTYQFSEK